MHRLRVLAAGVTAAALIALLAVAAPASAHDELLASSPAPGQVLATAPTEVSLQFSADVMTLGAIIVVADADGTDWAAAEPTIEESVVSVTLLPDMPEAGYELRWRVVSSDGHPIAGLVPFTVGDGEPLERAGSGSSTAGEAGGTDTTSSQQQDQDAPGGDAWRVVLIGAGGAVAAIAAYALIHFLRRPREIPAGTGASPTDRDDADDL